MNTKPRWFPTAVPTDRGWINPTTGEVLVAIGNLKTLLSRENTGGVSSITAVNTVVPSVNTTAAFTEAQPTQQKRKYTKRQVNEVTETFTAQIIAEVVEHPANVNVIGE